MRATLQKPFLATTMVTVPNVYMIQRHLKSTNIFRLTQIRNAEQEKEGEKWRSNPLHTSTTRHQESTLSARTQDTRDTHALHRALRHCSWRSCGEVRGSEGASSHRDTSRDPDTSSVCNTTGLSQKTYLIFQLFSFLLCWTTP